MSDLEELTINELEHTSTEIYMNGLTVDGKMIDGLLSKLIAYCITAYCETYRRDAEGKINEIQD